MEIKFQFILTIIWLKWFLKILFLKFNLSPFFDIIWTKILSLISYKFFFL